VAFQQSIREVEKSLQEMTEQEAKGQWRLMLKDKEISSKTRISVLRSIMLNHWYHHRVSSRLPANAGRSIPVIYGRSADESHLSNPWCGAGPFAMADGWCNLLAWRKRLLTARLDWHPGAAFAMTFLFTVLSFASRCSSASWFGRVRAGETHRPT